MGPNSFVVAYIFAEKHPCRRLASPAHATARSNLVNCNICNPVYIISRTHVHAFHACGYGTERDTTSFYVIRCGFNTLWILTKQLATPVLLPNTLAITKVFLLPPHTFKHSSCTTVLFEHGSITSRELDPLHLLCTYPSHLPSGVIIRCNPENGQFVTVAGEAVR